MYTRVYNKLRKKAVQMCVYDDYGLAAVFIDAGTEYGGSLQVINYRLSGAAFHVESNRFDSFLHRFRYGDNCSSLFDSLADVE